MYLREIWPTTHQIQEVVNKNVTTAMFKEVYATIQSVKENTRQCESDGLLFCYLSVFCCVVFF